MNARKYLAELIGTFILVFMGSMAIAAAGMMSVPVLIVVPFGFGLGLLAAIHSAGYVSGGHFNPAVTLAAYLDRRTGSRDALLYVVAQLIGAIAASGLLLLIAGQAAVQSTTTSFPPGKMTEAVVVEASLAAIFLIVILTVTKRSPNHAAFAIPLTLVAIHFAGIPFSGASVNPARSIAPALVSGTIDASILVYIVGPLVGAAIGWGLYRALEDGSTR